MPLQLFVRVSDINLSLEEYFPTPGSHELLRSLSWTNRKAHHLTFIYSNSKLWKLLQTVAKRQRNC